MDEYQVRTWEGWHHHMALSLLAVWFLIGETHRGQQWTPALTLPQVRYGLSVLLLEVFCTSGVDDICRQVQRQLLRNELARFYHHRTRKCIPPRKLHRAIQYNWLQVLDTTELAQIDQRVRHQFHAIVPLLDAFKAEQESFELIFPGKGALNPHPQRMDDCVEEAFASALRDLAVAGILFDIGDQTSIENAFPIVCGIKATIEVHISASQVQAHLFGHLLQRVQALWEQDHVSLIDGSYRDRR
jgi:hypothetical protein